MDAKVVTNTIADTLTCVEDKEEVKTGGYTNSGVDRYTVVDTMNKVKAEALVYGLWLTP